MREVVEKVRTKAIAVVGAQWGDEGKGKVVDYLASSFDYTARYAGGHNAGHTVMFDNHRYVLQLIPSGILRPEKKAVIGAGTVVDPVALIAELENLKKSGIEVRGRLFLSNRAHLIFPYHREMDRAAESARGAAKIGTTSRGIGPAYASKMARFGLRTCDLAAPDLADLLENLRHRAAVELAGLGAPPLAALGADAGVEQCRAWAERLEPYLRDTEQLLNAWIAAGRSLLFEGAQGTLLDLDHGTYPYVTSSSSTAGGACTGTGVPPPASTAPSACSRPTPRASAAAPSLAS